MKFKWADDEVKSYDVAKIIMMSAGLAVICGTIIAVVLEISLHNF